MFRFKKFWCGLYPTNEIFLSGALFHLSSLAFAKEVILFWEDVSLISFGSIVDFLFDPRRGKRRERCDIVIKNIGLIVDYFVEVRKVLRKVRNKFKGTAIPPRCLPFYIFFRNSYTTRS